MVEVPGENDSASNLFTNVEETDMWTRIVI